MQAAEIYDKARLRESQRLGYDYDLETEIASLLNEFEDDEAIAEILSDADEEVVVEDFDVSPSEFTEFAVKIPVAGRIEDFSFKERPYLKRVYDTGHNRVLMKCARQTEKSTGLGNISVAYASLNLAFKVLYVTATAQQATVFSVDRIRDVIEISPIISSLTTTRLAQNVFFKQFRNRSQIRIRYAFLSADRVRGISSDLILIDEIQDILTHNIPVIEQCASHSFWKLYRYSGTPKSMDNTIQIYWDQFSTQNEWMVPCDCRLPSRHWNSLGEKNIGRHGPICARCGKAIDPLSPEALWVSKQAMTKNNADRVTFEGFRIPQLMVPWIIRDEEAWRDNVLFAMNRYERAQFYNEVLGLSYDSGSRPLTRAQVEACCVDGIDMTEVVENASRCDGGVFVGIDWGCHDEETRILTQDGWKFFRDLTDGDLVAQWDADTRVMSLIKPEVRTIRDWDGPLYHFETKGGLDMMITGTHRMRVGNQYGTKWVTERADQTIGRGGNIKFVGHIDWEGEEVSTFTLPGLHMSPGYRGCEPITFKMDDWLEFLGYVLSEGGVCSRKNSAGDMVPYHLKMSQRESVSAEKAEKIKSCMDRMGVPYSEFPNPKTGDLNWSINGKQFWHWFAENMGYPGDQKRIPRQFLALSQRQLQILFDAMVLGDGYIDDRDGCDSGAYYSTSKGLCEDFQEVCIRIGRRCLVRLHKPAGGQRKTRWRAMWSGGRDYQFNTPNHRVKQVFYRGKVYCCKVPSGYIVTERNGCVAYQGNTGENESYTVIVLGGYIDGVFTIFFAHRFTGPDLEPPVQLEKIAKVLVSTNFVIAGTDYGVGYDRNDWLARQFGADKIRKMQHVGRQNVKVRWNPGLSRFTLNRTEVLSDLFNAIKRGPGVIRFPNWNQFQDPYGIDFLNVFSEYSEQMRMIQYKISPGKSDDTAHAVLYCLLASMIIRPRPDILIPLQEGQIDGVM